MTAIMNFIGPGYYLMYMLHDLTRTEFDDHSFLQRNRTKLIEIRIEYKVSISLERHFYNESTVIIWQWFAPEDESNRIECHIFNIAIGVLVNETNEKPKITLKY